MVSLELKSALKKYTCLFLNGPFGLIFNDRATDEAHKIVYQIIIKWNYYK